MIRVLEVLATLKRAGAETMVKSLVCRLDRTRFQPAIAALFNASPDDLKAEVAACQVPVFRLGKKPGFDVRMFLRLRKAIRDFRPDIIHTHSYVMRYTLPVARCAMVHTVHNLAGQEVDRIGRLVHRIGFRRGVVPVAVASEVARSFEQEYGFPPAVTIPNGIEVERFAGGSRQIWRRANGFEEDQFLIVSAARLEPQKNPRLLVEAFRALPPRCHLLLAGEGSLRPALEGVDRVHLLGVRTDLADLLPACDAFALASDWEGHPIALMEALAAGLPVVATAVGGVPEIVGDAGILVPAGDRAGLTRALSELAAGRERRQELSRRARVRARCFDVQNMVDAYAGLFQRVLQ